MTSVQFRDQFSHRIPGYNTREGECDPTRIPSELA